MSDTITQGRIITTQSAHLLPDQLKAAGDAATAITCLKHRLNALLTSARILLA